MEGVRGSKDHTRPVRGARADTHVESTPARVLGAALTLTRRVPEMGLTAGAPFPLVPAVLSRGVWRGRFTPARPRLSRSMSF